MSKLEVIAYFTPPADLLISLDKLFALKRQRGDTVQPESLAWLGRMQEFLAADVAPTDGLPEATWDAVGDVIVDSRKEMAF
jgi:hypothetical protein